MMTSIVPDLWAARPSLATRFTLKPGAPAPAMPERKKTLSISPELLRLSEHLQDVGLSLNDFLRLALLQPPQAGELLAYLDAAHLDPSGPAARYGFRLPGHGWEQVEALADHLCTLTRTPCSLSQTVRALVLWTAATVLDS